MKASELLEPRFVARLEKLDLLARRLATGRLRGDRRSARGGAGSEFRDHTRYAQGDDLRFLDWNVYSRLGELLVKRFDADETVEFSLFLDVSASMDFGRSNKFEAAQRISAALGYIALGRYAQVSLSVHPEKANQRRFFGRRQIDKLLRVLVDLKPEQEGPFLGGCESLRQQRGGRGLGVVVSDCISPEGYEEGLRRLRRSGFELVVLHCLDDAEWNPELAGPMRLIDAESGRSLRGLLSPDLVEAYRAELRRWCEGLQRFCRRQGIHYCRIDSAWSMERTLRRLLKSGGLLR